MSIATRPAPAARPRLLPLRPSRRISWEMLGREAGLALAVQPTGLIAAAAGPLLLSLVALLRTWSPLRAADQLLQAALYFAAWNTLFALVYLCLGWFRPRVDPKEAEQRHLPLSAAHFALRRLLHSSSVPLAGGLFTVLCWGALVLYYDEPYTIQGAFGQDGYLVAMAWVGVAILSAALLPAALAVWVEALTTSPIVRSLLLVALPASAWWLIHTDFPIYGSRWWRYGGPVSSGLLHEAYDSWCGVLASRFVIIGVLVLVLPVLYGLLRPWARWLLLALPVLAVGGYLLRWALPDALYQPLRPLGNYVRTTRLRHPAAYALAHLSPTMNIRLLLLSYPSNITLVPPDWRRVGIGGKALETAAERAEEYDAGGTEVSEPELLAGETAPLAPAAPLAALRQWWIAPSLPLWFGAALYPVLLSIWAVAGLLLGQSLRGRRAEGDVG